MKYLVAVIVAIFVVACGGYKPVPNYAADIFAQPVLTKVKIDPEDPDAGVYLQDELSKMAVNRLNLTLTKNVNKAKGYILVNSYTINTTPTNTDSNGSVIRYSVNAAIEFAVKDKYGFWSKNIVANEYVSVKAQSLISALDKEKASRVAIQKALDAFALAVLKRSREVGKNKSELDNNSSNQDSTQTSNDTAKAVAEDSNKVDSSLDNTTIETIEDDSLNQDNQTIAYDNYEPSNSQKSDLGIKIIPIDSNEDIIKDATNYN